MGSIVYNHYNYRPLKSREIKEYIEKYEFAGCEVKAISIPKWGEAYVAYNNPHLKDDKIWVAVVKIVCNNSREIGFKTMGEDEHPYYYNCPKKILKMLSETDNKYAKEWREECWKRFSR
jgi:hypothetical protein